MSKQEIQQRMIEDSCKFLNERARYKHLCGILLTHIGFTDEMSAVIIEQVKKAEFKFIEDVLKEMRDMQ